MTRYVVIAASEGKEYKGLHAKIALRSSVIVFLNNKAGAMFRALSCFALRDINVTQVSCRPSPMTAGHDDASLFECVSEYVCEASCGNSLKVQLYWPGPKGAGCAPHRINLFMRMAKQSLSFHKGESHPCQ